MISFSELNRIRAGQVCCCKGPQGAQGAQGPPGGDSLQSFNITSGAEPDHEKHNVAYDITNIDLLSQTTQGNGFNIKFVDTSHFSVLPFGGDSSNNAPLDNENNPIRLNHSSWLKIQLNDNDWGNINNDIRSQDNIAYIPIYWNR